VVVNTLHMKKLSREKYEDPEEKKLRMDSCDTSG
jgi:hypothetical protein